MKRILSGVQPTGNIHLGNYLGALRNWVALQNEYDSFYCIVNLHAITVPQDPQRLAAQTRELARIYLAAGVNPDVATIFVQSDVPEHAELAWALNCVARMSELGRMTQFKDKADKQRENTTVGLFTYPVLMAADILLYQSDLVPVGDDQKQHLELTRDLAMRFNRDYGETFRVPDPYIPQVGARIMSLSDPTKKMSKSDENPNGCVMLLDTPDAVLKKFKRAVTDSGTEIRFDESRPGIYNLLCIYQLLTGLAPEQIETHFAGKGYGHLKTELAEVVNEFLRPLQERFHAISDEELDRLLAAGRMRARAVACKTLTRAYERLGLKGAR
jgi:tryptophanyl-tRNA synthetase